MKQLTQEQLIKQLKMLKVVKPNKDWASLLKSQIMDAGASDNSVVINAQKASFASMLFSALSPKRLAYSFAALLFLVLGFTGFIKFSNLDSAPSAENISVQSQASLTSKVSLKQDVVDFKANIENLTKANKEGKRDTIPSSVVQINQNATQLAKTLKEGPIEDPETLNEIAVSLKVLADVPGTASPEVENLYKAVVEGQIADLKNATLTKDQTKSLQDAEDLYNQSEFTEALELLLLINTK